MRVVDPLFAAPETAAQLQQHRYRAEYVARELWRLYQQRTSWQMATLNRSTTGGAVVAGAGSLASVRAAYLEVIVPPAARIGVEEHLLRVWRSSLRHARQTLTADEEFAFEGFLNLARHNAIFRLEGGGVRRNHQTSPELARAALKLVSAAEQLETDR